MTLFRGNHSRFVCISIFTAAGLSAFQVANPTQQDVQNQGLNSVPIYRVTVVSRNLSAVNYHHRAGTTTVQLRGTELEPQAEGDARVDSRMGATKIDVNVQHLRPAMQYGPEFLTYVLWAISPEGRAQNLGELVLDGDKSKLLASSSLQAFGLIVTAEPYFSVTQPSDVVVMENFIRKDTTGTIEPMNIKFELLQRGSYVQNRGEYKPVRIDPRGPLQLAEAENAVEIARLADADRYAADTMRQASIDLRNAEDFLNGKSKDRKAAETNAREAAQMAEDARVITVRRIMQEQEANERAAAAEREAQAKAQAAAEAQRRAQADAQLQTAQAEREAAERARAESEQARAAADAARAQALQEQQRAQEQAQVAQQQAEQARIQAEQAEQQRAEMRRQLTEQLNQVLETRETARGLIVNMSDVLFDTGKYTLKPGAREKLAKIAGILLAHPGIHLDIEGHTDSVGSDEYNQRLSEERADSVRDYLISQGVKPDDIAARGLGKTGPVASNDTSAGRQLNRRVEMVVSGDIIGTQAGSSRTTTTTHRISTDESTDTTTAPPQSPREQLNPR